MASDDYFVNNDSFKISKTGLKEHFESGDIKKVSRGYSASTGFYNEKPRTEENRLK
jgi:hypothetical protein